MPTLILHSSRTSRVSRIELPVLGVFFLILLLAPISPVSAQNAVNILQADSIVGGSVNGERVQKILGNVRLRSDELTMYCDSAYQFVNKNEFRAFGNIEINTEEENIWADTLYYYTDVDFSQLRGRVIIEADATTLFGNSVDYRFSTKVAHFIDQVRLEDLQGILKANSGFYYREADSAVFRGQVQLADSLQYLEGDSLFSNRSSEYYEVHGDIFADDRENETVLKGSYLEADSTGRRLIEGNAWLKNYKTSRSDTAATPADTLRPFPAETDSLKPEITQPDSLSPDSTGILPPDDSRKAETDTTHIRAETILSVQTKTNQDTTTTIHAYDDVRIWSPKFSAVSDTARYESDSETFELWSNPIAWHDNVQLTGPYILVLLQDGEIEQLRSYPHPFAVQQDTTLDRLNQIKGDTLRAYFTEGALTRIVVEGNSHLLRFTKDEAGNPDGAVEMTAPATRIFFESGELTELKAVGNIRGSYLPESEQTAKRRLEGFSWNPDLRPQRPQDKMEPRFPPIPDEPLFTLPKRYRKHIGLPNTDKMDRES